MRSNFNNKSNMNDVSKDRINHIMNKNSETYNTHIFERNILNSKLFSTTNQNPVYFSEEHKKNRIQAESIFNKRFTNVNNIAQGGKLGYVDFTDSKFNQNLGKKDTDRNINFSGNYAKYLD